MKKVGICLGMIAILTIGALTITNSYSKDTKNQTVFKNADDVTPRKDKAEVVIKTEDKVKVGDLILIDLSESIGGGFDYYIEPKPPGLRFFDNGKIIVCGTGDQNVIYKFMISCALNGNSDINVKEIRVVGAAPPGPPPKPGENLIEKIQDWASEVESPTKRDDAIKLAQSFSSMAFVIEQDTFTTLAELLSATKASNKDALNGNLENWRPFTQALNLELKTMADNGLIPELMDHAKVWRDIAKGLETYANTLE